MCKWNAIWKKSIKILCKTYHGVCLTLYRDKLNRICLNVTMDNILYTLRVQIKTSGSHETAIAHLVFNQDFIWISLNKFSFFFFFFNCYLKFLLIGMAAILEQRSFQLKFLSRRLPSDFFLKICKMSQKNSNYMLNYLYIYILPCSCC